MGNDFQGKNSWFMLLLKNKEQVIHTTSPMLLYFLSSWCFPVYLSGRSRVESSCAFWGDWGRAPWESWPHRFHTIVHCLGAWICGMKWRLKFGTGRKEWLIHSWGWHRQPNEENDIWLRFWRLASNSHLESKRRQSTRLTVESPVRRWGGGGESTMF